jgi:hypothetical protein
MFDPFQAGGARSRLTIGNVWHWPRPHGMKKESAAVG